MPPGHPREGGSLGPTLGWHAQSIDGREVDTVFWVRPTNAGVAGLQKEMANRLIELGLGAVLLPFVCLAEVIFGDGCDADDAFDLAQRVNPITLIEGAIPGIGSISGPDYVGGWHFIDVGAIGNRYNDPRGMLPLVPMGVQRVGSHQTRRWAQAMRRGRPSPRDVSAGGLPGPPLRLRPQQRKAARDVPSGPHSSPRRGATALRCRRYRAAPACAPSTRYQTPPDPCQAAAARKVQGPG